ncbi:hypothetical protein BS78_03G081800, partial [Paspalum vaginatum]
MAMSVVPVAWRTATTPLLALAIVVALAASSCGADASPRTAHAGPGDGANGVLDRSTCEVMVPCNVVVCTQYCVNVGLRRKGFCTLLPDLLVYCCCPV